MDSVRAENLRQLLLRKLGQETGVFAAKRENLKATDKCPLAADEGAQATQDMSLHAAVAELHSNISKSLRDALNRLETGTYGACTDCGLDIEVKRLEAVPFAARCRGCQEEAESDEYTKTRKRYQSVTPPDNSYTNYKR